MPDSDSYLLYALSGWRETSWERFKRLFDTLYTEYGTPSENSDTAPAVEDIRRRTVRMLDLLGHCDVYFGKEGGKIQTAPPVLARLPVLGVAQAVLCGSRSPDIFRAIKEAKKPFKQDLVTIVTDQRKAGMFVPYRIGVEAASGKLLEEFASALQIEYSETPPAWKVLDFAGSLETYLETLEWREMEEPNWLRRDFDAARLMFYRSFRSTASARLTSYEDPVRLTELHYLWKDGAAALVDRDWGRYALLQATGVNVLVYDPRRLAFAVPTSTPLPRLLSRALGLCSGHGPRFASRKEVSFSSPETRGFDLFPGVPGDVAHRVAECLGQELQEARLSY